jgi:glycosyltransferase involved in cell wall biosynthesis
MLKDMFAIQDNRIELFYENGISKNFFTNAKTTRNDSKINLLFVGRLVPYKCADILIESISQLEPEIRDKIQLTIVGDGSEKDNLEKRVQELQLGNVVKLAGWVSQAETLEYYRKSDIFCFPSIREFGGAVVLEAMACGLPCIVANNGGIGEYVTEETGLKIEPLSREYLTQELTKRIKILVEDEKLRKNMSAKSIERAQDFEWGQKGRKIAEIYERMLREKGGVQEGLRVLTPV